MVFTAFTTKCKWTKSGHIGIIWETLTAYEESVVFSWHPNKNDIMKPHCYASGWKTVDSTSLFNLAEVALKHPVSWCVWRGGQRRAVNFISADFVGLDFDGHVSLAEAKRRFRDLRHIISASKNHQKKKNGSVKDRFHIFLALTERCENREILEMGTKKLCEWAGADHCFDSARWFAPSPEVLHANLLGRDVDIEGLAKEALKRRGSAVKKQQHVPGEIRTLNSLDEKMIRLYHVSKTSKIAPHISELLKTPPGGRNRALYQAARDLAKCGYSYNQILDLARSSSLAFSLPAMPDAEIENTIKSAMEIIHLCINR